MLPDEGYDIDVIMPAHCRDEGMWRMTTRAIEAAFLASGQHRVRVVLIDNASPISWSMSLCHMNIIVIPLSVNLGFVKATNLGLARSTAPYVVFMNNDAFPAEGIFDRMKEILGMEGVGIVGPVSSSGWQDIQRLGVPSDTVTIEDRQAWLKEKNHGKMVTQKPMVAFFCAMVKRETVKKIGYLSESYGIGFGDDDDYCKRIKEKGMSVVQALDCYCEHNRRTTFRSLWTEDEIRHMQREAKAQYVKTWGTFP